MLSPQGQCTPTSLIFKCIDDCIKYSWVYRFLHKVGENPRMMLQERTQATIFKARSCSFEDKRLYPKKYSDIPIFPT